MKECMACGLRFVINDWQCPSCGYAPEKRSGYWIFSPEMMESNDGFDPDYFMRLAGVEERNWWFRSRNKIIIWALRRYFPQAKNFHEGATSSSRDLPAQRNVSQALPFFNRTLVKFLLRKSSMSSVPLMS